MTRIIHYTVVVSHPYTLEYSNQYVTKISHLESGLANLVQFM